MSIIFRGDTRFETGCRGFTLIELMIVVAIVGILAAIAVPIYSDFIAKSQFSEAFSLAGSLQTGVEAQYHSNQGETSDDRLAGIDSGTGALPAADTVSGKYVSNAEVKDGKITLTFGDDSSLDGKTVTLTPDTSDARFTWDCDTTVAASRTPSSCR